MNWLKKLFGAISKYFKTGSAARQAQQALEYVAKAMPFVVTAGNVIVTLTPTGVDDAVWKAIKAKYPKLLDGSAKTIDELKAEALVIAAEMLQAKFPELTTSVARAAAQLAYIDWSALKTEVAEA